MAYSNSRSTFFCPSGTKWYWEFVPTTGYNYAACGITTNSHEYDINPGGGATTPSGHGVGFYGVEIDYDGTRTTPSSPAVTAWAENDIIGFAYDVDANTLKYYLNGSLDYTFTSVPVSTDGDYSPSFGDFGGSVAATININFGSDSSFAGLKTAQGNADGNGVGDFYYSPPSGHLALCTSNLSDPSIALPGDNFNTVLYTGNGGASVDAITGVGFQPDIVWIKSRSASTSNYVTDAVRGIAGSGLLTDSTAASDGIERVSSFDSDGFTLPDTLYSYVNTSSGSYVAWNWLGANAEVTNTEGTNIDSTVSANPTAGFSICKYTATGTIGDSFGHGLTQKPDLLIFKNIDTAFVSTIANWTTFSDQLTTDYTTAMSLDKTTVETSYNGLNQKAPTASVVELGDNDGTNYTVGSDDYICYCFHSVEGYSKIGSYEGNSNADGPFIYTGFRPAWLMMKSIDVGAEWYISDNKRSPYNLVQGLLHADTDGAEQTSFTMVDYLSNGFKLRNSGGAINANSILYLAFAESPFKYSNAR